MLKKIDKVYGPYACKDGRARVCVYYTDGTATTQTYAKFLWEEKYGPVPEGYEVDHINENLADDRLDNLQLLTKSDNINKQDMLSGGRNMWVGICPVCGDVFMKEMRNVKANLKAGKRGPFCTRQCAGKADLVER